MHRTIIPKISDPYEKGKRQMDGGIAWLIDCLMAHQHEYVIPR